MILPCTTCTVDGEPLPRPGQSFGDFLGSTFRRYYVTWPQKVDPNGLENCFFIP